MERARPTVPPSRIKAVPLLQQVVSHRQIDVDIDADTPTDKDWRFRYEYRLRSKIDNSHISTLIHNNPPARISSHHLLMHLLMRLRTLFTNTSTPNPQHPQYLTPNISLPTPNPPNTKHPTPPPLPPPSLSAVPHYSLRRLCCWRFRSRPPPSCPCLSETSQIPRLLSPSRRQNHRGSGLALPWDISGNCWIDCNGTGGGEIWANDSEGVGCGQFLRSGNDITKYWHPLTHPFQHTPSDKHPLTHP